MAKVKEVVEDVVEPACFPVTLDEFLTEVPKAKAETKAGFKFLCKTQGIIGSKMREEWQGMFNLFETKPVKITWAEWQEKGGK